jgi:hypothetical protein
MEDRISWHEFVDMKLKFILLLYDNDFIFYASLCKRQRLLKMIQEIRWMDAAGQQKK